MSGYDNYMRFEKVVERILSNVYEVSADSRKDSGVDFITASGIGIDVIYSLKNDIRRFISQLRMHFNHVHKNNRGVVFVTNTSGYLDYFREHHVTLDEEFKKYGCHIITLENLLFLCDKCDKNEQIKKELLSCLEFSTESVVPMKLECSVEEYLKIDAKPISAIKSVHLHFYDQLKKISKGIAAFREYEDFCKCFISTVFQNNLDELIPQFNNNKKMNRFDLIAALKSEPESFWRFIYEKFNSSFIVFECKNYNKKISQEHIYLTERYLFDKALRSVAIMLTRVGADQHAVLATHDILKEHGKFILILNDTDLKELERYYYDEELSPSEYLMKKAKEMLMEIDK